MKIKLFCLSLLLGLLLSCSTTAVEPTAVATNSATPIAQEASQTPTNTVTATEANTPIPSATFTATPPPSPSVTLTNTPSFTPTPTLSPTLEALSLPGPQIAHGGISFTLDSTLAAGVVLNVAESPLVVAEFALVDSGLCREVGCVTIYDTAVFRTDIPGGAEIVAALQAMANGKIGPFMPTWGAAILLEAQTEQLTFQNGTGARAIVMRGQDGFFANNEAIIYNFQGLTADGKYYVNIQMPLDAPFLLSTYDPAANINPNALPVPNPLPDDYLELGGIIVEYNQEAGRQLDELDQANFTPTLVLLDGLVQSLIVMPETE